MGWTVTSIARYYILQTINTVFDYKRNLFLDNNVLGVNAGWSVTDREGCSKVSGQYQVRQYFGPLITFAFARGAPLGLSAVIDVKHIASDKFVDLARRLG